MKKILIFLLSLSLLLVAIPAYASDSTKISEKVNTKQTSITYLTYDQAMERIAQLSNKSVESVKAEHPSTEKITVPKSQLGNVKETNLTTSAMQYAEIKQAFSVAWNYSPSVDIIVQEYRDGSFGWLGNIQYAGIDRNYLGTVKQFSGDMKAWVDENYQQGIYYIVNGDFYDTGTTTISSTVGAGTPVVNVNFNISYATNYFKYCNTGESYISVINY
ncbi:hypothetical protein REC12_00990 [Desulfosporosinus sp. PR]|uniref:hypothetical protein n=1 Tax=Candidatus Desulfosporosinus nitrosoreducens TaxID=3401928 RepID=UPI0027EF5CDC|nr:hypothetical protein [Desulfosporosinus sp. PR]MDQ7092164.1 hypothetical protein [Desulfosporosinus sp. PR]